MQRFALMCVVAVATAGVACAELTEEPYAASNHTTSNLLNGQCTPTEPDIFRPECTAEWNPNDPDHTLALNAAFTAARAYQDQNNGVASHVLLEGREYKFRDTLNAGWHPYPPGIIVRNEDMQQGPTRLVTDDPHAFVKIQGGDIFQYLIIQGPHRNTGPRHGVPWSGADYSSTCAGPPPGPSGLDGGGRHGWTFFMSAVEGFNNQGIILAATTNATVSHATVQDNGGVGIQLIWNALDNTIQHSTSRYNGLNGIDINAESTYVRSSNASYNGWNSNCTYDRNGILVWGTIGTPGANDNVIEDNDVFENDLHGIWVGASHDNTSYVAGNTVKGNRAFDNASNGIMVIAKDGGTNTGTLVDSNTIYGNGLWGLRFEEVSGSHIQSGVAYGNQITSSGSCVFWSSGAQVLHSWNYCNGTVIDPVYLDVTVTGPTTISSSGQHQWTANASAGTGSYSYQWYRRTDYWWPHGAATCQYQTGWVPVGTGQSYATYVAIDEYDFRLRVDVISGSENDSHSMKVYGDGTQPCPL